ncbi:anterior gradient protein 2 homolog isoform X2 [Lissotriton helveticus]
MAPKRAKGGKKAPASAEEFQSLSALCEVSQEGSIDWPQKTLTQGSEVTRRVPERFKDAQQEKTKQVAISKASTSGIMQTLPVIILLLILGVSCCLAQDKVTSRKPKKAAQTMSRGWGDNLYWTQTYEEALYRSQTSQKPLMVIHHLEDCKHSQALKKVFVESQEAQKLAEDFILINLTYETTDKNLSPDGQYVPRIMFIDPSLTVRADITGPYSNRQFAYEPKDLPLLISNMRKAQIILKAEL